MFLIGNNICLEPVARTDEGPLVPNARSRTQKQRGGVFGPAQSVEPYRYSGEMVRKMVIVRLGEPQQERGAEPTAVKSDSA